MTYALFDSFPLIVDRQLATLIGLNEAIILQQIHYWLKENEKYKRADHFLDGKWWTYNTYSEWNINDFPFWSESTLIRSIKKLEALEILVTTDKYNKKNYDKTKWYTIDYEKLEGLNRRSEQEDKASSQNDQTVQEATGQNDQRLKATGQNDGASSQNDQSALVKMTRPIPETTTETNTENSYTTTDKENELGIEINMDIPKEFFTTEYVPPIVDLALGRFATLYQGEIGRPMTKIENDGLKEIYDLIGEDLAMETLKRAVLAGTRNIRYMEKMAINWRMKGIKSLIDLECEDKKFGEGKLKSGQGNNIKVEKPKIDKYAKFYL